MKIYYFLIAFILFLSFESNSINYNDSLKSIEIKLIRQLEKTSDNTEKYQLYNNLSSLYYSDFKEVKYLVESAEFAKNNRDTDIMYENILSICKNYYNRNILDSLEYWVDYSSELYSKNNEYDKYFEVSNYYSHLLISKRKYKDALAYTIEIQAKADELNHEEGELICYELLGMLYSKIKDSDGAIENYTNAYRIISKRDNNLIPSTNILSNIIIEYLEKDDYNNANKYLILFEKNVPKLEKIDVAENQYNNSLALLYCFYAEIFIHKNDLNTAKDFILKLEQIEESADVFINNYSKQIRASYYKTIHKYNKAIKILEQIEPQASTRKLITAKADIYREIGDYKNATFFYKNAYDNLLIEVENDLFQEYTQLRVKSDLFNLKSKNYALILKEQEMRTSTYLTLSILLCVTLIIIIFFYLREKMLKNKLLISELNLQLDKKVLTKTKNDLQIAWSKAEESNIMKSTFLSNMSHEIRTPLNSIVGFSDMISESYNDPELIKQFAEIIKTNSDLLLKLLNDIFDISKIDSGSINLELSEYDITACAHNALNSIEEFRSDSVSLIRNIPNEPIIVKTDPKRIQQILFNLLNNSAKFTTEGEIEITVEHNSDWVFFIVRDTGCGIPEEMQSKVFERFHKVNEYSQGSGLGLSISVVLANMIGGDLVLDKTYVNGARFIFSHPKNIDYDETLFDSDVYKVNSNVDFKN